MEDPEGLPVSTIFIDDGNVVTICKSTKIIRKGAAEREQIRRERFAEFWAWVEYTFRKYPKAKALGNTLKLKL